MKNIIYSFCEDLTNFLNVNIAAVNFKTLEILKFYSFEIPDKVKLTVLDLEEIKKILSNKQQDCVYIVKKVIGYLGIAVEKNDFFLLIGPFLMEDPFYNNNHLLFELKKNDTELYKFYLNLKKVKISSVQILDNIVNGLVNKDCNYSERIIIEKNRKKYASSLFNDLAVKKEENDYKKYNILDERYVYENLMLDSIKNGNTQKAKVYFENLSSRFDFSTRMPFNHLRAKKNGIFIISGIIRKTIEELKVPYLKIHIISSEVFYLVENSKTIKELKTVIEYMIEKYTELCVEQKENAKTSGIMNKALFFIEINIEKNITVKELAEFCNVSLEHISRTFKKEKNISLKKYILKVKIEKSLEYLANYNYSIRDVSIKMDFSSTDIYVKNFKNIKGITPTEYRKKYYFSEKEI